MSDSHDNRDAVRDAVRLFNDAECRMVLHAGDFVAPFAAGELAALRCPVTAVFGNCDGEKAGLERTIADFGKILAPPHDFLYEDRRFLLTHTPFSNRFHVASGRYDVLIYGHTHRSEVRREGGTLIINPGETGGWVNGRSTVALLDVRRLRVDILSL